LRQIIAPVALPARVAVWVRSVIGEPTRITGSPGDISIAFGQGAFLTRVR